nr:unnamed protein product [Spirometra erinaceieuropaei]
MSHERPKLTRPVVEVLGISCLSASISTVLTQPLEVIKTRLQAQIVLRSQSNSGVLNITNQIWQDSCLLAKGNSTLLAPPVTFRVRIFWSGTVPALWRCVPGIALYFSTLNLLESRFPKTGWLAVDSFLLGSTTRTVVGATLLPFTVVKARAEAGLTEGLSMFACLRKIYVENGPSGLFRGLVPTLVRDSPYSGIYLVFYTALKKLVASGSRGGVESSAKVRARPSHSPASSPASGLLDSVLEPGPEGVEWNAKVRTRPHHPPAPSLVSGLPESVWTPGPGGEEESVVDAAQVYSHYKSCASHRPCSHPAVEHTVDIVGSDGRTTDAG